MLAIVSGHLLTQSSLANVTGTNHILAMLLGSGVRIGVNVFLILGVWFMVDAKFKAERIVRLYLEVFFYSVPITICMLLMGEAGGLRNILQGMFPFFGRSVWFASAYISSWATWFEISWIFSGLGSTTITSCPSAVKWRAKK